jgi:hypothetical protein
MKPRTSPTPALGSVRADEVMPGREYCRRMGHGRKAWDELRKRGFPVIRCGKQVFVDGAAAIAYFRGLGAATDSQSRGGS